jgi:uridine phosphorylase
MTSRINLENKTILINEPVPEKGITCSNRERILRLSQNLEETRKIQSSWGTMVIIGNYQGKEIFLALAPVGSGSGLVFTELYAQGASAIIRFGSDDVPNPSPTEAKLFKIIDEADNLYGYSKAIGVDSSQWGKSIPASPTLVEALKTQAQHQNLSYEIQVCHHLESYHALRNPEVFPDRDRIQRDYAKIKRQDKKESMDMETAVLLETARLFGKEAASVLQTVDKEKAADPYYQTEMIKEIYQIEKEFFQVIFAALFS